MSSEARKRKVDKRVRKQQRQQHGEKLLNQDIKNKQHDNDWDLGWFSPEGAQVDCLDSFNKNLFTIVDAPSGCGKTTTALWFALSQVKERNFNQLIFIKNPTEAGDDQVGFLSGSEDDKLKAHMDVTKRIFESFISKNKLENDLSKERIRMTIPNFLLGTTFDNAIVVVDEAQTMSPNTIKLLLERCGLGTKYIILGDCQQAYSVKKRGNGFRDLIERTTVEHQGLRFSKYEPMLGYVKMTRHDNQRSDGSKFINKLYEE